jgi:hypothetical protein
MFKMAAIALAPAPWAASRRTSRSRRVKVDSSRAAEKLWQKLKFLEHGSVAYFLSLRQSISDLYSHLCKLRRHIVRDTGLKVFRRCKKANGVALLKLFFQHR